MFYNCCDNFAVSNTAIPSAILHEFLHVFCFSTRSVFAYLQKGFVYTLIDASLLLRPYGSGNTLVQTVRVVPIVMTALGAPAEGVEVRSYSIPFSCMTV